MSGKSVELTEEQRNVVDLVVASLKELSAYTGSATTASDVDRLSVHLRKLVSDEGAGHYVAAWKLVGLPGEPMVYASDLDAMLARSGALSEMLIWVEAPLAKLFGESREWVTDSSKFVPSGLRDAQLRVSRSGPFHYSEVVAADGATYLWGLSLENGSIVATKYEPGPSWHGPDWKTFRGATRELAVKIERYYTLDELRKSTAVATGEERISRSDILSFVANKRGAHIARGPSKRAKFSHDVDRDSRHARLRSIPGFTNELHMVFRQLESIGEYIAASSDTAQFLERCAELPKRNYWYP